MKGLELTRLTSEIAASRHSPQTMQTPLWGDGFDADALADMFALHDWDTCSPDEMIRVFPRLVRPNIGAVGVDRALMSRIRECVTVLSWRSRSTVCYDPKSVSAAVVESNGESLAARWFCPRRVFWNGLVQRAGLSLAYDPDREHDGLVLVDAIATEIDRGALRAFDPDVAAEFVYWTGIHPVYLWPAALSSHGLYTAIGWIGHAERYGRALMTSDIAEYFLEAIDLDGRAAFCESPLSRYIRSRRIARTIFGCAKRRLAGRRPVVRLPLLSSAARPDVAYGHLQ